MENIALSIIIVTYNTADVTLGCLGSLAAQDFRHHIEIVVVDNGSVDDSIERIEREHGSVRLIRNEVNAGFAQANNLGMRATRGRYVLLLNSDTVLTDNGLDQLIDWMDDTPGCGLLTCRLLNPDGSYQPSLRRFPSLFSAVMDALFLTPVLARIPPLQPLTLTQPEPAGRILIQQAAGAFLLLRRSMVDEIGMLDDRFFMYYEDVDYCLRVAQSRFDAVYTPDVSIIHLGGSTYRRHRMAATRQRLVSKTMYFAKHHPSCAGIVGALAAFEYSVRYSIAWAAGTEHLGLADLRAGVSAIRQPVPLS